VRIAREALAGLTALLAMVATRGEQRKIESLQLSRRRTNRSKKADEHGLTRYRRAKGPGSYSEHDGRVGARLEAEFYKRQATG
jgi:hypothetical protein